MFDEALHIEAGPKRVRKYACLFSSREILLNDEIWMQ